MSDRSGQNDTDNSFAGISFEGVNAVPPQSGENGDTINLADVADVSEQDDVSNAATETMPPLNFASDQTQPFQHSRRPVPPKPRLPELSPTELFPLVPFLPVTCPHPRPLPPFPCSPCRSKEKPSWPRNANCR